MSGLHTTITTPEAIASDWDGLADHLAGSPFLRPDWFLRWHDAYGRGSLIVFAAFHGERLAGVLPIRRRPGLRFSPTNWHTPVFGILAEDETVARALVETALSQRTLQLQLAFVDRSTVALVKDVATGAGRAALVQPMGASPFIPLEGSFADYRARLSRNTRSQLKRRRRDLEARGEIQLSVHDVYDDDLFADFLQVESSGWKEAQGSAIISSDHDVRFYREIARWGSSRGWLRLAFLRLNGQVVAGDLAFECGGVHYLLKTGYDAGHEAHSPGRLLREEMLHRAFEDGLTEYDLLGQDSRWKRSWRPSYQEQFRVQVFAPGAGAVLRPLHAHGRPAARAALHLFRSWRGHR